MTSALTRRADVTIPPNGMDLMTYGKVFAASGFFADSRDAAQAIVKIQAGAELGFPPVASMTGVHIIKGRVSLSANLIAAAIKRSGKYTYRVLTLDDKACEIEFVENGEPIGRSAFTIADAKKQATQNVDRFPRNMLFARALSNGAKWYTPDVFGGSVYTPDELGGRADDDGGPTPQATPASVAAPPADDGHDAAEPATVEQLEAVRTVIESAPSPVKWEGRICEVYGLASVSDLTFAQAGEVLEKAKAASAGK